MKNKSFGTPYFEVLSEGTYRRIQDQASLPVPLFLVILDRTRIYISRYHFEHSMKKDFRHKF